MGLMKCTVGIFEFILENEAEDVIVSVAEGKVPHLFYREDRSEGDLVDKAPTNQARRLRGSGRHQG